MSFKIVNINFKPSVGVAKAAVMRSILSFGTDSTDGNYVTSMFPSANTVAIKASVHMRTAQKYIAEWRKDGALIKRGCKDKGVVNYDVSLLVLSEHVLSGEFLGNIKTSKVSNSPTRENQVIDQQVSCSPTRGVRSVSCSPTRGVRTISLPEDNNLKEKKEDFIYKIKEACKESEKVHSSDGHAVVFNDRLIEAIKAFVSNPPEWISSESHACNHILKQIRNGQYTSPDSPDKHKLHQNIQIILDLARSENACDRKYELPFDHKYAVNALKQANIDFFIAKDRTEELIQHVKGQNSLSDETVILKDKYRYAEKALTDLGLNFKFRGDVDKIVYNIVDTFSA